MEQKICFVELCFQVPEERVMHLCNVPKTIPPPFVHFDERGQFSAIRQNAQQSRLFRPCFCALSQDEKKLKKIKVFFKTY